MEVTGGPPQRAGDDRPRRPRRAISNDAGSLKLLCTGGGSRRGMSVPRPRFFSSALGLRRWFGAHHDEARELWVGFYRKGKGPEGLTYLQAVDEALCFGWIDTMVRRIDERRYAQRFAPRQARSPWSPLNRAKALRLVREGRMTPAGLAALRRREPARDSAYADARRASVLPPALRARMRKDPTAWTFFSDQPPSYRRVFTRWVVSAKRPETQLRRMDRLIRASGRRRRLDPLTLRPAR